MEIRKTELKNNTPAPMAQLCKMCAISIHFFKKWLDRKVTNKKEKVMDVLGGTRLTRNNQQVSGSVFKGLVAKKKRR